MKGGNNNRDRWRNRVIIMLKRWMIGRDWNKESWEWGREKKDGRGEKREGKKERKKECDWKKRYKKG